MFVGYLGKIYNYLLGRNLVNNRDLNADIVGFPQPIEESVNWYLHCHESYLEDKKYRLDSYNKVRKYLLILQKDGVKIRRDLYLWNIDLMFLSRDQSLQTIFIKTGWLPLDPCFDGGDDWGNAEMILTDESIALALERYKIPFNRDWCYCLASDFVNRYDNK